MALISVPTTPDGHTLEKCPNGNKSNLITANSGDEESPEGVSLENVLSDDFQQPEGYHWYFLRVSYGRAEKLYNELKDRQNGYFLWMPCVKTVKIEKEKKTGTKKKTETLTPIFKSNLFIYSTEQQAFSLTHRDEKTGYPYVDFTFDHTVKNKYGRDEILTIPFLQMKNFMKAANIQHPWAHVVTQEKITFRPGGYVRVIEGPFAGVVGKVARVFGQTRVVITIPGIVQYATAYISQNNLEPCEAPEKNK